MRILAQQLHQRTPTKICFIVETLGNQAEGRNCKRLVCETVIVFASTFHTVNFLWRSVVPLRVSIRVCLSFK